MSKHDAGESVDQISELQKIERPRGLEDVLDRNSLRILESLD